MYRLLWTYQAKGALPSHAPLFWEDKIYLRDEQMRYHILDEKKGRLEWEFDLTGYGTSEPGRRPSIVQLGRGGWVYALDSKKKPIVWQFATNDQAIAPRYVHVEGGEAFVSCGSGRIYGLDWDTGRHKWTHELHRQITDLTWDDPYVYYTNIEGWVWCFHVTERKEKWALQLDEPIISTPSVHEETLYVTGGGGSCWSIDKRTGSILWRGLTSGVCSASVGVSSELVLVPSQDGRLHALHKQDGSPAWQKKLAHRLFLSPEVDKDLVYVNDPHGQVHALQLKDGKEQWRHFVSGALSMKPCVRGDRLYLGGANGTLYAYVKKKKRAVVQVPAASSEMSRRPAATLSGEHSDGTMFRGSIGRFGVFPGETRQRKGSVLWTYKGNDGFYSSPIVDEDTVYIGSQASMFYAIDRRTGREKWSFSSSGSIWATCVVTDRYVCVGCDKEMYCLDKFTGRKVWTFSTGGWSWSSPSVVDGVLYFGSGEYVCYALDIETGQKLWATKGKGRCYFSPVVLDGVIYGGTRDGSVYELDRQTGKVNWSFKVKEELVHSSCCVMDDVLYFGGEKEFFYALDIPTQKILWKCKAPSGASSSPAVTDEMVYFGCRNSHFMAVERTEGKVVWKCDTQSSGNYSSPAVVGDVVYFGSNDHYLYAYDRFEGKLLWKFKTDEKAWTSPFVYNDIVYMGTDGGSLYAIQTKP